MAFFQGGSITLKVIVGNPLDLIMNRVLFSHGLLVDLFQIRPSSRNE